MLARIGLLEMAFVIAQPHVLVLVWAGRLILLVRHARHYVLNLNLFSIAGP